MAEKAPHSGVRCDPEDIPNRGWNWWHANGVLLNSGFVFVWAPADGKILKARRRPLLPVQAFRSAAQRESHYPHPGR